MKKVIKYLLILFIHSTVFSQVVEQVKPRADVLPHSPEVEAMMKNGLLPLTLYTGLPQISVPVFEIKASGLTVPFSLSYNYNGFKPIEAASWCGLGWNLQGAGSISRIIKGKTDGSMNSGNTGNNYDDFVEPTAMAWNQTFVYSTSLGIYDTEPDVYVFNIGEYSGKFILIRGQAYLFPHQNIKISSTGTGFKMTDDKGNTYLFNDAETTYTKNADIPVHTSAWHISKIITADKADTISYSYDPYSFKQPSTFTDSYSIAGTATGLNTTGHTFSKVPSDGDHVESLALASVTSRYGTISFIGSAADRQDLDASPGAKALERIRIISPQGILKELVLVHDYLAGGGKLRLTETYEEIYDNDIPTPTINQHYLFEYNTESHGNLGERSIDYWGYYNGASNQMLFPEGSFSPSLYPYANRNACSDCSSKSIIKKITYPTGGYSTFEFEQNKKGSYNITSNYSNASVFISAKYNPIDQVKGYTESGSAQPFTINTSQMVKLTYGDGDDYKAPTIPVVKIYRDIMHTSLVYSSPVYQDLLYNHDDSVFLEAGSYYITASCENGIAGTDLPYGTYATLNYKDYVANNTLADGPGLRIKKISSYDGISSTPALVREYAYNHGIELTRGAFATGNSVYHDCAGYFDTNMTSTIRSAVNELADNQFYYGEVTETSQDATKTGKTVYTFGTASDQLLNVNMLSQTDYKWSSSNFIPVKNNTHQYKTIIRNAFTGFSARKAAMVLPVPPGLFGCLLMSSPDITQPQELTEVYEASDFYTLTSDYTLLNNTQEIIYNDDGSNLTSKSDYYYDNAEHIYPTRIITVNSNGEQITQEMKYPFDYNFSNCSLPDAINKNFVSDLQSAAGSLSSELGNLIGELTPYQPYSSSSDKNQFSSIASRYHCQSVFQSGITTAILNRNSATTTYLACVNGAVSNNALEPWKQSIAWMQLNNVVSPVIEKYVSIRKADGNEYLLSATRNEYNMYTLFFNPRAVKPVSIKQTEINGNLLKSTFLANKENYYKAQLNYFYDASLKLVGQQKVNDMVTTYLYGYNQHYPIAEIKNLTFSQVLTALGMSADQYKSESMEVFPSANYIARLNALRQTGAVLTTYTYKPLVGVTAVTDANNKATYYEYDATGRLVTIKDHNNHIVKTFNYHYKQP